jgi:integrase
MARGLTAKAIENAKPGSVRREIADEGCRGLYLVVQPTGRKSWAVRYRFQGKPRKLTLEGFPSLAEARKAAADALHQLANGTDPAAAKLISEAEAQRQSAGRAKDTFDVLVAQFIAQYARKKTRENTARQTEHILNKLVLSKWHRRTVHDIRRRDVIDLIEGLAEDRPIMANRALATLSKFFNWLASRDVIAASPCAGVPRPSKERARDRVLTDEEVKSLWTACDAVGNPVGGFVKMMLLTGQRRSEVAGMRRSEIVGDVWVLPPDRTKNGRKHEVPLSPQALAIIEALPPGDCLFGAGERVFGGYSRAKNSIDQQVQLSPWTFHDLRRTMASGMAALGIALPVIERVLNHISGTFRGVLGVYQRHEYANEKRVALQRWADHVAGELAQNVVPLRAAT